MTTAADYAGRTYDVAALRPVATVGEALAGQSLLGGPVDPGGDVCTGAVKLAQWFIATLLTAAGSKPYDPADGSSLPARLASGQIRTETDAFIAFGFAAGDVKARARQVESPAAPADERLADAVLTGATVAPGLLVLAIRLTTQAGGGYPLILPIPTVP